MLDFETPFTPAEAKKIVSQTTFVAEYDGVWNIEVQSSTYTGTLVEATTENEYENVDDRDRLPSTGPITEMEQEEGHGTSLMDIERKRESKIMEDALEREYRVIRSVKQRLAQDEGIRLARMAEIMKLKERLACKMAELREIETIILPQKRTASKDIDKEYYAKLKKHEDSEVARRKQLASDSIDTTLQKGSND